MDRKSTTKNSKGMNVIRDGWFSETDNLWPGFYQSIEVDEVLVDEKSKYQHVLLFKSKMFGKVLTLDNAVQLSEFDEFSYQEMISFLPLNSHPDPRQVLVIGGGDGGVIREVVKHPAVQSVHLCEIDERVIEVSKQHLPFMATGFTSPKLTLHIGDGNEFMAKHSATFDIIITDSSDPVGPAKELFQQPYYEAIKKALKPGGIACCQCESMWFNLDLIKQMVTFCKTIFPVVAYAYTTIPSYPGGHIGFILCGTSPDTIFSEPVIKLTKEEVKSMKLKYYNSEIHKSAFVLPQFVLEALDQQSDNAEKEDQQSDRL
ncbi:hypothetical protein CHUAL_000257 [Chamberlinius hualienensis]